MVRILGWWLGDGLQYFISGLPTLMESLLELPPSQANPQQSPRLTGQNHGFGRKNINPSIESEFPIIFPWYPDSVPILFPFYQNKCHKPLIWVWEWFVSHYTTYKNGNFGDGLWHSLPPLDLAFPWPPVPLSQTPSGRSPSRRRCRSPCQPRPSCDVATWRMNQWLGSAHHWWNPLRKSCFEPIIDGFLYIFVGFYGWMSMFVRGFLRRMAEETTWKCMNSSSGRWTSCGSPAMKQQT